MAASGRGKQIAISVLSALLAAFYALVGAAKLGGAADVIEHFRHWGYPDWFRIVIGVVELLGAAMLLIPRAAFLASAGLSVVMLGAIFTHLKAGEGAMALNPLVLLVLLVVVGYVRRPPRLFGGR